MKKHIITLVCLIAPALQAQAQGLGFTVGVSSATPQKIEDVKVGSVSSALVGVSYQTGRFEFGATYRGKGSGSITVGGEPTEDRYSWGYTSANASLVVPIAGEGDYRHALLVGASYRMERGEYATEFEGEKLTVDDKRGRIWFTGAYRLAVHGNGMATEFFLGGAVAKKDAFDSSRVYSEKDTVRLFAPSFEVFAGMTLRF